eukprot:4597524-Pyramimonas_sp.AAC.1
MEGEGVLRCRLRRLDLNSALSSALQSLHYPHLLSACSWRNAWTWLLMSDACWCRFTYVPQGRKQDRYRMKSSRCRAFYDHALQDIRIACRESSRTIFKAACSSSRKCPRRGCPNAHIGARAQRPRRERCSHPQTGRTARLQEEWWDWKEAPKALGIPM